MPLNKIFVQLQYYILSLMFIFFLGCTSQPHITQKINYPAWYGKESFLALHANSIAGFGEGITLVEARANAKEMIAQTLSTHVESIYESRSTDQMSHNKTRLNISSKLNLNDLKTEKQTQKNGLFFVAMSYENISFAEKIKQKIPTADCLNEPQNTYLLKTPLFEQINTTLGCKKVFTLQRKNSAWYLQHQEHLFLLQDAEIEQLFVTSANDSFAFTTQKLFLIEEERFYFDFSTNEDGYITLVNVFENGVVVLLQESTKILNKLRIPSLESSYEFEAGVLEEGRETHDLFVAFFSKQPLDMSRYTFAGKDFAEHESAYKFHELLSLMQTEQHATILLRTRAKNF